MLHIGHQREDSPRESPGSPPEELDIELEGKKLTQEDSFVYLGGASCGDVRCRPRPTSEITGWSEHVESS